MATSKKETTPQEEPKIPFLTVVKNGAILKNIYLLNHLNPSPSSYSHSQEEILTVGRHPDCDIVLMHPSISRFHLQITTNPFSHQLFVTDLSSVHGTWVSERKIEPGMRVELKDGDTIRVGGSTRVYRLHWVPMSHAFDRENPFFFLSDVATVEENEEEFADPVEGNKLEMSQEKLLGATGEFSFGFVGPSENEDLFFSVSDVVALEKHKEEGTDLVEGNEVEMSKELFGATGAVSYGFVDSDDDENPIFSASDLAAVEENKEENTHPVELGNDLELSQEKLLGADGRRIVALNDNEHPFLSLSDEAAVEKNEEEYPYNQLVELGNEVEMSQVKFLGASGSLSHKEERADPVEGNEVGTSQNEELLAPVIERFEEKISLPMMGKEEDKEERKWGQNPALAGHGETRCLVSTLESITSLFSNEVSGFDVRNECPFTFFIPKNGVSSSFVEKEEIEIPSGANQENRDRSSIKSSREVTSEMLSLGFNGHLDYLDSHKVRDEPPHGYNSEYLMPRPEITSELAVDVDSLFSFNEVECHSAMHLTKETENDRFSTNGHFVGNCTIGTDSTDIALLVKDNKSHYVNKEIEASENLSPWQPAYEAEEDEKITESGRFNTMVSASSCDEGDNALGQGGHQGLLTESDCIVFPAPESLDSCSSVMVMMPEITYIVKIQSLEHDVIATTETMENLKSPSIICDRFSMNDHVVGNCTMGTDSMDFALLVEDNKNHSINKEIEASGTLSPLQPAYEAEEDEKIIESERINSKVGASFHDEGDSVLGRGDCSLLTGRVCTASPATGSVGSFSTVEEIMSEIANTVESQIMESVVIAIKENMGNLEIEFPETLCPSQLTYEAEEGKKIAESEGFNTMVNTMVGASSHDEGKCVVGREGDCSLLNRCVCTKSPAAECLDSLSTAAEMMSEVPRTVGSQTTEFDVIASIKNLESLKMEGPETLCPLQVAYENEMEEKITESGRFNTVVDASSHDEGSSAPDQGGDHCLLTGSVCSASPAAESHDSFSHVTEMMSDTTDLVESQTSESDVIATMESMKNLDSPSSRCEVILSSPNVWSTGGKLSTALQTQVYSNERKVRRLAGTGCEFESEKKQAAKSGSSVKALFLGLETMEAETFLSDKENRTPNAVLMKKMRKGGDSAFVQPLNLCRSSSSRLGLNLNEATMASLEKENQTPGALQKRKAKGLTLKCQVEGDKPLLETRSKRVPLQSLPVNLMGNSIFEASVPGNRTGKSSSVGRSKILESKVIFTGVKRREWIMVADTKTLLDRESRKSLWLLQGLKGTQLVIPRSVMTELECLRQCGSFFLRTTDASIALAWIEECLVESKWWIHVHNSTEEGRSRVPTSAFCPQSCNSESRTTSSFPFLRCWSQSEVNSSITEDHILHCALQYRRICSGEKVILLSSSITLMIKAMAEGLFCETAREFRDSLVNPFSERFMWAGSSPRGRTWTVLDDIVLKERYSKKSMGECARGLQLFLLYNSENGRLVGETGSLQL